MRLKKSKRPQGIRTKSDYVPETAPETSSIAQKAAALTFKNLQSPSSTKPKPTTTTTKPKPPTPVQSTKQPSPSKPPTKRFSIHSYATNKTININSNNKVTSESSSNALSNHLEIASPSSHKSTKRNSTTSNQNKFLSKLNTTGINPSNQDQISSPSAAAMAAATVVAKANPKSMVAVETTNFNKDKDPANVVKNSSSNNGSLSHGNGSIISRQNSTSSEFSNSPYSLIATSQLNNNNSTTNNNNSSGQFSFKNSHSSLPLYSSDNRSSRSLISTKEIQRSNTNISTIANKKPLQTEVISEHNDEHAPAGLGVTSPTSPLTEEEPRFVKTPTDVMSVTSSVADPLKNKSTNSLLFNNDQHNQISKESESPLTMKNQQQQNHPYSFLIKAEPNNQLLGGFTNRYANNDPYDRNLSVGSDSSHDIDFNKSKNAFLYQSPLAAIKKNSLVDNSDLTSMTSETTQQQQQQQQRRKPPPPASSSINTDKETLLLPPPNRTNRLSLSSDFNIDSSPQLSALSFPSFNSSTEDLKSKKTRKPPPPLSPLETPMNDLSSYFNSDDASLQPPPIDTNYNNSNKSTSTFDEEDLSSMNDSTLANESATTLPKYPTYTSTTSSHHHHHHPHLPMNKSRRKFTNNARAFFGRSKSSQQIPKEQVFYVGNSDHSNANLNPATISQTAILVPQHTVRLKTTMRKDKKGKEFNVDKPWKHHNDIDSISEQERKRYEGVWVANKDLCMDLAPKADDYDTEDATKAAKTAASQKIGGNSALMHRIIVREIFKRSRLPAETLRKIYNLVDHNQDGFLRKDEFIVGMWLIDQCLYGRKLPKQVGDYVWESVHNAGVVGVNITIGKKKKK